MLGNAFWIFFYFWQLRVARSELDISDVIILCGNVFFIKLLPQNSLIFCIYQCQKGCEPVCGFNRLKSWYSELSEDSFFQKIALNIQPACNHQNIVRMQLLRDSFEVYVVNIVVVFVLIKKSLGVHVQMARDFLHWIAENRGIDEVRFVEFADDIWRNYIGRSACNKVNRARTVINIGNNSDSRLQFVRKCSVKTEKSKYYAKNQ